MAVVQLAAPSPPPRTERPSSLEVNRKKRLTVTEELLTVAVDDDQHSISSLSQHSDDDDDDAQMLSHDEFTDMLTPDDIDTPDELEESIMERKGNTLLASPFAALYPRAASRDLVACPSSV